MSAATYVLPAIPLLGLVAYGFLRQIYVIFYGSLGASPEDVGLGYSQILGLSAMAVVGIGIVGAGVVVLLSIAAFIIDRAPISAQGRVVMEHLPEIVIALSVIALAVAAALLWPHRGQGVVLLVVAVVVTGVAVRWPGLWRHVAAAIGVFVVTAYLITGIVLSNRAEEAATYAFHGYAVRGVGALGVEVLGLFAEPTSIVWADGHAPSEDHLSGHCVMYLGQANGVDVFYDPGPPVAQTFRVQASAVILSTARAEVFPEQHYEPYCSNGQLSFH